MVDFNWTSVEQSIPSKRTQYDYEQYKQYFRKVAFDRFKSNSESEQLWELRQGEDGKMYLYALYGEPEDVVTAAQKEWEASPDSEGKNITLSYKQVPIYRFASQQYQFSPEQAGEFANFIEAKSKNAAWVNELLSKAMSEERKAAVLKLIGGAI